MKTKLNLLLLTFLLSLPVLAFELDTSVDEEIRKNYNPSALEKSLPALPKTSPSQIKNTPQQKITTENIPLKREYSNVDKSTAIRIKKGTKFKVKSNYYISDNTNTGTHISFTTVTPVIQRYVTLPAGTVLTGVVTDSHPPQMSGNGGLVEIAIDGINYKGKLYYANGKIIKVNSKKVFINNIKGKRKYWKSVSKQVDKGENFYKKTRRTSAKWSDNPIGMFVSPVPVIFGTGVYAINLIASPIISIGSKGDRVSIPAGTMFEIKMLEDVYLKQDL